MGDIRRRFRWYSSEGKSVDFLSELYAGSFELKDGTRRRYRRYSPEGKSQDFPWELYVGGFRLKIEIQGKIRNM